MSIPAPAAYHDFQGLAALRSSARSEPGQNLKEVAGQFEAIFFQMMLKSMRDATQKGELFSSSQLETYQQMFDQQLSLDLSRQGGLGLAEILVEQLGEQRGQAEDAGHATTTAAAGLGRLEISGRQSERGVEPILAHAGGAAGNPGYSITGSKFNYDTGKYESGGGIAWVGQGPAPDNLQEAGMAFFWPGSVTPEASAAPQSAPGIDAPAAQSVAVQWQPSSPEEFIQGVWSHAVEAAAELGVDPAILIAQSALETGWGKKVIRSTDGSSSLNLFGIKTGADWSGKSAVVNTLEYQDGVAAMERASFRAYDSLSAAFSDYVGLLKDNPRYQGALAAAEDGHNFLRGLQDAGYATDPGYADKIMDILDGGPHASLIQELKNSAEMSLSG